LKVRRYAYICTHNFAGMVKLVDMPDLGSGAARRVGSSPITRTFINYKALITNVLRVFYFFLPPHFPRNDLKTK
jgi:hypothetical protein